MIPAGVQVYVALEPVDMRYGFERLAGVVRERIGYEPRSGALFVFFGRRRQTVKIVFADGTGMCVFHKRLDRGTFTVIEAAAPGATHVEVDDAAFEALLDGLDLSSASTESAPREKRPRRVH